LTINPVKTIDFAGMQELADGDTDFLADLYQEIINQFVEARDGYTEALPTADVETLRRIAHKVSPNLQSLDIDGIPQIFSEVKERLNNGESFSPEEVQSYQRKITEGFDYCIGQLKQEIANF
jgi:hypothetical protein